MRLTDRAIMLTLREQIFATVCAIPRGGIVSYADVARVCGTIPVLVGKALAQCGTDVPWQRVIGQGGELRTARRGAEFAARQRALLEAEGIRFGEDGCVGPDEPGWERGLASLKDCRESRPARRNGECPRS